MLLWADDFGRYGTTESLMLDGLYAQVDSPFGLDTTNPRTGTYALRLAPAGESLVRRIFGTAKTTVGVGYACYMPHLPVKEGKNGGFFEFPCALVLFEFRDTTNASQFCVILGTDGSIELTQGLSLHNTLPGGLDYSGTVALGRSDPCVAAGSWNQIQCMATAHATSGTIEIRCNNVTVLSVSGVKTITTGNVEYSQVVFGQSAGVGSCFSDTSKVDYADLHSWDDTGSYNVDFPGDNKAFLGMPNGDSGPSDWTRSSGANNYALIDEIPPNDDTDTLTSSTPTDQVQVDTVDLPVPALAPVALLGFVRAKKSDAGDCKIKIGVVSNGTSAFGDEKVLTTGWRYYESIFETDPDTGLPWTNTAINAAKLIYERTV